MIANAIRLLLSFAIVNLATLALAGDLNPPGAPESTSGPEPRIAINSVNTPGDSASHFQITEPGSYYLEDNLIILGTEPRHGIVIEADNVTVDLSGFTLDGYTPTNPPHFNLSLSGILASGERESITVRNGTVRDWGDYGIDFQDARLCRVEDISTVENELSGIFCGQASLVYHCLAEDNTGSGIIVSSGGSIVECVADGNGQNGITGGGEGCTVIACTSRENGNNGIGGNFGCTITQCTSNRNSGDGINTVNGNNLILNNTCYRNGYETGEGAGIHSHNGHDRIEGNLVHSNDWGIEAYGSGSLIIRNSARYNTTAYDINGPHTVGPILTGTGTITSTNPWANFDL
jgi:parallel beta-helix repeat protein